MIHPTLATSERSRAARIVLQPIGVVRPASLEDVDLDPELLRRLSCLRVWPEFREGLSGIEAGDEVLVLFWMHGGNLPLRVRPSGHETSSQRGVFATRSRLRPNPIGATTTRVVRLCGHRLIVERLDARVDSLILDIRIAGRGEQTRRPSRGGTA